MALEVKSVFLTPHSSFLCVSLKADMCVNGMLSGLLSLWVGVLGGACTVRGGVR